MSEYDHGEGEEKDIHASVSNKFALWYVRLRCVGCVSTVLHPPRPAKRPGARHRGDFPKAESCLRHTHLPNPQRTTATRCGYSDSSTTSYRSILRGQSSQGKLSFQLWYPISSSYITFTTSPVQNRTTSFRQRSLVGNCPSSGPSSSSVVGLTCGMWR